MNAQQCEPREQTASTWDCSTLTKSQRWSVADCLADDVLPSIDSKLEDVTPASTVYSRYIKRILDLVISIIVLVITSPINLIVAIVTFFDVGTPLLFRQKRAGRNGTEFSIIKFRNMKNTCDSRGELLPPNQRVTKWGKFVRKTSIDELLNFVSIAKGDMSIIGPRPLPPEYVSRYNKRHRARLAVRPGLECPPREQVDSWTWQDQFDNDVWYVENVSFVNDCKMVLLLVRFALDSKNASIRGGAQRGTFMGYSPEGSAICLEQVPSSYIENELKRTDYEADSLGQDDRLDNERANSRG